MKKTKWAAILAGLFSVILLFGCRYMTEGEEADDSGPHSGAVYVEFPQLLNETTYETVITVIDKDLKDQSNITVRVFSLANENEIYLPLVGNGLGKFTGYLFFGTEFSSDASLRRIYCSDFSGLTVTYYDANPAATVMWTVNDANAGAALYVSPASASLSGTEIGVALLDPGNTGDTATVRVWSYSGGEAAGIDIALTGLDGYFSGYFYVGSVSGTDTIGVVNNAQDYVYVTYYDSGDGNTYSAPTIFTYLAY